MKKNLKIPLIIVLKIAIATLNLAKYIDNSTQNTINITELNKTWLNGRIIRYRKTTLFKINLPQIHP